MPTASALRGSLVDGNYPKINSQTARTTPTTALIIRETNIIFSIVRGTLHARERNMKEWYQRKRESLLVLFWGLGAFALGFVIGRFVFCS